MWWRIVKEYNEIWEEDKNLFRREFDSDPPYNNKYINSKIKIYKNRIYTIFHYKKIPENIECFFSLSVTLLDSIVVNTDKKCYPQIFLEECKYALEKKKMMNTGNE